MAIVKVSKGGRSLKQAIRYADKEKDFIGKDVSDNPEKAINEMQLTKDIYNKPGGRQYKHYIISFKPGEVDREKAKAIALEFAEKNFKGYEVGIGTHTDKNHIHCHLIVNSVSFEIGKKLHVPKSFLEDLRKSNDEICKTHGLEIVQKELEKEMSGEIRTGNMKKYQVLKHAFDGVKKSYVLDAAIAVKKAMELSENKQEFIENMNFQGYKTNWSDTRKHVTFIDKGNNKVRLANLQKTFNDISFSKEGLELEFKRNIEQRVNLNIEREVTRAEQTIQSGIGEQYIERTFDRVYDTIRELENELRKYSPSGREAIREEQQDVEREIEQINREQSITREILKRKNRYIDREIEPDFDR